MMMRAAAADGTAPRSTFALPMDQTTTDSASTTAMPVIDSTVSISDQDLMFWLTDSPKYCLVSQKPASLTCEKNSEPAPIASTNSETWDVLRVAVTGCRMPAVVTVATVADPVASRISTATNQASSNGDTVEPCTQDAITLEMPLSTSTCLSPPPAATISRMPAIGGSAASTVTDSRDRSKPAATPSVYIASSTASSSAISGVP